MSGHARRKLIRLKDLQSKIPSQSFRAFLQCIEMENFLLKLEKYDFNILDSKIQEHSSFKVWYQMSRASRKAQFLYNFNTEEILE